MNKRTFLILLALIAAVLVGWVVWSSSQAKATSVDTNAIGQQWWGSAHADIEGEAFSHWNGEEAEKGGAPAVPPTCAKCHSTSGFVDYIGGDESEAGKVDKPAPIMQGVQCAACHNGSSAAYTDVTFPSSAVIKADGDSACVTCHSGMTAGLDVDKNKLVVAAGAGADDTPLEKSSLMDPHYFHTAAVHSGADGESGYEYAGKTYAGTFVHDEKVNECIECHDPHTLRIVKATNSEDSVCSTCHSNVKSDADYRMVPGKVDYDGDGQVEPVAAEIEGFEARLKEAITKYSAEKLGKALAFNFDAYPYGYIDTNVDGKIDGDEGVFANSYNTYSPRLLRAGFNLLFSHKEPGAYVHNAKYVLQLMYDSIEDLGSDLTGLTRP